MDKKIKDQLVFGTSGVLGTAIVDFALKRKFPQLSTLKRKGISSSSMIVPSVGASVMYKSTKGYAFAAGSLVYGASSLLYASLNSKKEMSSLTSSEEEVLDGTVILNGEEVPIATKGLFKTMTFKENPNLDLGASNLSNPRNTPLQRFVLHHGGHNPFNLAEIFKGGLKQGRRASTHFGLGFDEDGSILLTQYVDMDEQSWHAGPYNLGSIGIDFALSPTPENASRYNLPIITVDAGRRGQLKVLDLPDNLVKAMYQLLKELHRIYGLEMKIIPDKDFINEDYRNFINSPENKYTVFGHHNFTRNRWDVVYVWDRLLDIAEQDSSNV